MGLCFFTGRGSDTLLRGGGCDSVERIVFSVAIVFCWSIVERCPVRAEDLRARREMRGNERLGHRSISEGSVYQATQKVRHALINSK
jgi:hypothetical protein